MNVKLARIKKGLTQARLREITGISSKKMVAIERGIYDTITFKHMKRLAEALDSTIQDLFLQDTEV